MDSLSPTMLAALACLSGASKATLYALHRRGLVSLDWKEMRVMIRNGRCFGCDYSERTQRYLSASLTEAGRAAIGEQRP